MRWFFLTFIALLAIAGNSAIFETFSVIRGIGGVTFNLIVLALLLVWWASYFSKSSSKGSLLVGAHATLMFASGMAICLNGITGLIENSCTSLFVSNNRNGLLAQAVSKIQSLAYCRELGIGIVLLGLFVAYPSIRLFFSLSRRAE